MLRRLFLPVGLLSLCSLSCSSVAEDAAAAAAAAGEAAVAAEAKGLEETLVSLPDLKGQEDGQHETHEYQAEVSRLMDIIINSLYTQRDVFLRELISNAVDALEKARFLSLTGDTSSSSSSSSSGEELAVFIESSPENKIVSVCDNGVGMSKQELITNLGTVAKSGTSNFLETVAAAAKGQNELSLVGQFGVGFYSSFLVADRVSVVSRSRGEDQYIWQSSADAKYYINKDPRGNTIKRGTCVVLHLKADATEFAKEEILKKLASRYSQFLAFPIYIKSKKIVTEEVEVEEEKEKEKKEGEEEKKDDVQVEDVQEETEGDKVGL
ncbi:heat shock protein 90, putative [Eimeria brunetti]|uniref:Heat shock protein 90, putative n=1 Tax=Eimeria brunetti TaxID=51314 RepID=U6LXR2_9EIME|nr:heat shock protein 90, putative [Eimeria brunetti]